MTFVIEPSSLNISIPIFRHLRLIRQPKGPDRVFLSIWDSGTGRLGEGVLRSHQFGVDDMRVIGMQCFFLFSAGCALVPFFISVG